MKVRMRVSISGSRNGQPWPTAGSVIDLPDREAAELCQQKMAEPVTGDHVERAVPDQSGVETRPDPGSQPEQRTRRRGRPKLPRDDDGNIIRD